MTSEHQLKSGEHVYFSFAAHEKPTIAYFSESPGGEFANEKWWLWQGVMNASSERDMNVLHISGSDFSTNPEAVLYDLLDKEKLNGLLTWHSFVSSRSGSKEFPEFLSSFNPLPVVTIENKVEGYPAVLIDNFFGMRKLIDHFVSVHHFKRIAMLNEKIWHSLPRIDAYRQTMREYGLSDDAHLLITRKELDQRIQAFPDQELGFEALITAIDSDAIDIMQQFQKAGIRIPQDVAVTGYNDGKDVRLFTPPITAISLPFYRMGYQATAILYDQIQGHPVPSLTYLPLGLSIRESCGCNNQIVERIKNNKINQLPFAAVWSQRGNIIRNMVNTSQINHRTRLKVWVNQLLNSFLRTFSNEEDNDLEFINTLKQILNEFTQFGEESMDFNQILSTMRSELIGYTDEISITKFETLFQKARVLIAQKAVAILENRNQLYLTRTQVIRDIEHAIMLGQNFEEFFEELTLMLPRMEIPGFYLITFVTPEDPTGRAKLRFAYRNGKKVPVPFEGIEFPGRDMLPDQFQKKIDNSIFIIEDLHVEEDQIGYLIFECDNTITGEDGMMYSIFSTQIGSVIKAIHLRDEVRSAWQRAEENSRISEERRVAAEEANLLKSRFLSLVSHELRNPINLITTNTALATKSLQREYSEIKSEDNESLKLLNLYLDRINYSALHLNSLIGDVLDLTRSQLGKLILNKKPVKLQDFLEQTAAIAAQMTEDKGLQFEKIIQNDLPTIEIDEDRFRQVMLNLLGNAVKFTEQGKIILKAEKNNSTVSIAISDTGIGIPLEEQSIIFNEFQQSHRTSARGFGGMGLGLAISQKIIDLHQGEISVQSSGVEGIGSTFTIHLPLQLNHAEGNIFVEANPNLIYFFSSNSDDIERVVSLIDEKEYTIQIFPVTSKAFITARKQRPAVILLNITQNENQGAGFLTELKTIPNLTEVPIIFLASGDEEHELQSSMPITTLQKPFELAHLQSALYPYLAPSKEIESGELILIVDDDPDILQSAAELIKSQCANCEIITASNGKVALQILKEKLPDLVLLDLNMPELNGFAVIEAMQSDPVLQNIPVIVVTAQSLTKEDMTFFESGVVSILQKGVVDDQTLGNQIDLILKKEYRGQTERRILVRNAIVYIHHNYKNNFTRSDLAKQLGVNEDYLTHCFSEEIGMPPNRYLNRYRIEQAKKQMLENPNISITQTAIDIGFSSQAYFSRVFRKETGLSPKQFRTQN